MGPSVGAALGVIERIGRAIAVGESAFDPASIELEAARLLGVESPWRVADAPNVVAHTIGLGPLAALMEDPDVTDILVNGPSEIWIDRGGGLERVEAAFASDDEMVTTVERVISPLGLRIDRSAPMVDARLPDGSRLHAVLPPAAVDHPLVAIRRFTQRLAELEDLVGRGSATADQIDSLRRAVLARETIVISGGTGAGKTTLLNLLTTVIPASERVVTIEDAAELRLSVSAVRLEARPPNAEGAGEITIRQLLRSALRLRPDRIVVGEVRGPEALDLVTALNTGHEGSMTTVHANSPEEALWRIETLALMAGNTSETAVHRQLLAAVDLVVQVVRGPGGRRIVAIERVAALTGEGGRCL